MHITLIIKLYVIHSIIPPIAPSRVFLGLTYGHSFVFPNCLPKIYAPISHDHAIPRLINEKNSPRFLSKFLVHIIVPKDTDIIIFKKKMNQTFQTEFCSPYDFFLFFINRVMAIIKHTNVYKYIDICQIVPGPNNDLHIENKTEDIESISNFGSFFRMISSQTEQHDTKAIAKLREKGQIMLKNIIDIIKIEPTIPEATRSVKFASVLQSNLTDKHYIL